MDLLLPYYADTCGDELNLICRSIIYSADSLRPSSNDDRTFTVGPAIGAQFETVTNDDFNNLFNPSDYVGGMFLFDPFVNANGITSYKSTVSYNRYEWVTVDRIKFNVTYITPPEQPVTGGTGKYLCASGSYNGRFLEDLFPKSFFNITGAENDFGIFILGRLLTCNTCQPFFPKCTKRAKKNREFKQKRN